MRGRLIPIFVLPAIAALHPVISAAQQSDISLSPFVAVPTGSGIGTLAGLGLTFAGGSGVALRVAGRMAMKNTYRGAFGAGTWTPPWGADVDAMFALSGRPFGTRNRSPASFVFIGVGTAASDTADVRSIDRNWSYGVGSTLPVGGVVDLFAESRWRIARFLLPTARSKPARSKELRFGLSLHLPGNGLQEGRGRRVSSVPYTN